MVEADAAHLTPALVAPETEIARDMALKAIPVGLVLVAVSAAIWQVDGALTSALAVAIIVVNFLIAAAIMSRAARISPEALMGAILGGFMVRMATIAVVVFAVKDESWVVLPVLAFTLLLTQLGLLFWETRFVSASLAYPGLKPKPRKEAHRP